MALCLPIFVPAGQNEVSRGDSSPGFDEEHLSRSDSRSAG